VTRAQIPFKVGTKGPGPGEVIGELRMLSSLARLPEARVIAKFDMGVGRVLGCALVFVLFLTS